MKRTEILNAEKTMLTDETLSSGLTTNVVYQYNNFVFVITEKIARENASPLYAFSLVNTEDEAEAKNYSLPIGDLKKKVGCTYKRLYSTSSAKIVILSDADIQAATTTKVNHVNTLFDRLYKVVAANMDNDNLNKFKETFDNLVVVYAENVENEYKEKAIEAEAKKHDAEKKEKAKNVTKTLNAKLKSLDDEKMKQILAILNA